MIKKLFYSALLLAFAASSGFSQSTYFLQGAPPPIDMTDINNWKDIADSTTSPSNFSDPSDTFDLAGVHGDLGASLTIAGSLKNSSTGATIYLNGFDLILQGVVQGTNLSIIDNAIFPVLSTSVVEYAYTGAPNDIIPGTYSNMLISGTGNFLATGDITINKNLSTSGSSATTLVLGGHQLIDTSSFAIGSLGSGTFTIETSSSSTSPIPVATWPAGTEIKFNGTGTQYLPSGHYEELTLAGTSTSVNIQPGDTVKILTTFSNATTLILEASSASSYAQLISDVSMTGAGSIEQQMYLDLGAYTGRYFHLGSGLTSAPYNSIVESGATMVAASGATGSVWTWNAAGATWNAPSSTSDNTTPGDGVATFVGVAPGGPYVTSASGVVSWEGTNIQTSDVSTNMFYFNPIGNDTNFVDPTQDDGWNFKSNPFTANLDFENHTIATGMYNSYSVWNGDNYEVYQQGGTGTAPSYIAPGQGVWLRLNGAVSSLSYDLEFAQAKMNSGSTLKSTQVVNDMLALHVEEVNGTYHDDAFIRLYPQATDAEEPQYDAAKMFNPGDVPNLYVKLNSGSFAICGANVNRSTFPLYFMDANNGQQMEITISRNTLTSYGRVFLEDKKNNTFTDLTATGSYIFNNDKSFGADRFVIHFESGVGLPEGMIPGATAYDAFYSNGTIQITFQEESFKPSSGNLYTLQGKLVSSFEINDANTSIAIPNVSTGIYLLAIDGDTAGARKLYINK